MGPAILARLRPSLLYPGLLFLTFIAFYGGLAWLWSADHGLYIAILKAWGVDLVRAPPVGYAPWPPPFFDLEGVLSWSECARRGIDVFLANPCDVLNRTANYSPFVVDLPLDRIGVRHTLGAGLALDSLFVLLLPVVLQPRTLAQFCIAAAAGLSHAVLFALERANIDVLVFVLIGATALLPQRRPVGRLAFYAIAFFSGLLKFYPFGLLLAALRERRRVFMAVAGTALAGLAAFVAYYWRELGEALAHLPPFRAWYDVFGFAVLPTRTAQLLHAPGLIVAIMLPLFALIALGAARIASTAEPAFRARGWRRAPELLLLCGCILVAGCYFLQVNIGYRAVFLLFVIAGLMPFAGHPGRTVRRLVLAAIAATLACLWIEPARVAVTQWAQWHGLHSLKAEAAYAVFFVLREALWWCEVAMLCGFAACFVRRSAVLRGLHRDVRRV